MDNLEKKNNEAPDTKENPQNQLNDQWQANNPDGKDEHLTKERYKEILDGKQKQVESYKNMVIETEVKKATKDPTSLVELHNEDPKLAKQVAEGLDFSNYWSFEKFLEEAQSSKDDKWLSKDNFKENFEKMYQDRRTKEKHQEAVQLAHNSFEKLEWDLAEQAKEYFDDLVEWKQIDTTKAKKYADMATLYVSKDKIKEDKFERGLADFSSLGIKKSKSKEEAPIQNMVIWIDWKLRPLNSNKSK